MTIRAMALAGVSLLAFGAIHAAQAQTVENERADEIQTADEIVVQGNIGYRNRTLSTEPTLEYGEEYFQRFEPLTAGDALKRVPGVTFLSDVIESDGPRLRGLDSGYTQILINGERVPGAQADRSFFLDRIPAELIDRVEIIRSSSARRTGDAVAGTINIVLRDGFALDGGYLRGGALRFDDATLKESAGLVWGGEIGPGRLLFGANVQGRYNPKQKLSLRYGDSPENDPDFATNEFEDREDQTDIRDGRDYSFNADYEIRTADDQRFQLSGFLVITDRTESERSFEYGDPTAITLRRPIEDLLTDNRQEQEIDQTSYSVIGRYDRNLLGGRAKLQVGYASFDEGRDNTEAEIDFDVDYADGEVPEFEIEFERTDIDDTELSAEFEQSFELSPVASLAFGAFHQRKDRDVAILTDDDDFELGAEVDNYNQFLTDPFALFNGSFDPDGTPSRIEEDRLDFFALLEGAQGRVAWEAGLRYETTDVSVDGVQRDYDFLLPSAHLKIDLSDNDRITISGARTVRRPNFNFITPGLLETEFGENDFLGNPGLNPETAWGGDIGFERRLGQAGVVGVNFFYRAVQDLIELSTVLDANGDPVPGSEDDPTDPDDDGEFVVLTPTNSGDGEVYGVEFDLSTPLTFIGLPDTGLFGNVAWLESSVTDVFGDRRFNDQSKIVYNFGVIQDLPNFGAAFGLTYRKQGEAFGRIVGEEVTTTYGADLEVFVEKRFGKQFTMRFVGSNLLNGSKDETFNKFDTIADQLDRDFDEYEIESEQAGPWFQLIGRLAF